jgi:hypothetical protein
MNKRRNMAHRKEEPPPDLVENPSGCLVAVMTLILVGILWLVILPVMAS